MSEDEVMSPTPQPLVPQVLQLGLVLWVVTAATWGGFWLPTGHGDFILVRESWCCSLGWVST